MGFTNRIPVTETSWIMYHIFLLQICGIVLKRVIINQKRLGMTHLENEFNVYSAVFSGCRNKKTCLNSKTLIFFS